VLCSWTLENDTDTRTNGRHYTAADRRSTNQVMRGKLDGEVARHAPDTHDFLRISSRHPHEDATRKMVLCNLSFTPDTAWYGAMRRLSRQLRRRAASYVTVPYRAGSDVKQPQVLYFASGRGAKYCDECVCLSGRSRISRTTLP